MGNIVVSADFAIPTAYVSSDAVANTVFPPSWINDYTHPYRQWRSVAAVNSGVTYVGLDYGVATTLVGVFVDAFNVQQATIGHSADGVAWTTDATFSVLLSPTLRLKWFVELSAWSYRYIRICTAIGSTVDDTSTMAVGSLVGLSSLLTFPMGPGIPYGVMPKQATIEGEEFIAGGSEPVEVGNPYSLIKLSFPIVTAASKAYLLLLGGEAYSKVTPMLYFRNNGDGQEAYMCRRIADVEIEQAGHNAYRAQSVILREYV